MPVPRPKKKRYTSKQNDTWTSIAKLFNVKAQDLIAANPSVPNQLTPGVVLRMPSTQASGTGMQPPPNITRRYTGGAGRTFVAPGYAPPPPQSPTLQYPAPLSYPHSVRYDVGPSAAIWRSGSNMPVLGQREQYLNIWAAAQQGRTLSEYPEWWRAWQGISPTNMLNAGYVPNPTTGTWVLATTGTSTGTGGGTGTGVGGYFQEPAYWEYINSLNPSRGGSPVAGGEATGRYGAARLKRTMKTNIWRRLERFPHLADPRRNQPGQTSNYSPTGRWSDFATLGLVTWRI